MIERELFAQALEIPAAERAAFLERAGQGNAGLVERVQRLLAQREDLGSYLEVPAAAVAVATREERAGPRPGVRIGRYRLLEQIGEGGMGTVWVAEQTEPVKRRVALKLIKLGMDSRQVLARFEAERQALALMDHPSIAKVFDGGMTDEGRPFFVMEYVKGEPITEFCDNARLSIHERLNLFIAVCQAVQHAHQKGVIHRDIKPSNVLVCLYDGVPVPKVIDFGLAKAINQPLTERTLYTAHGLMVGTPLYMSPEQAEFNNLDIDTRSDIYSLGILLYELLTGSTPLEQQQFKDAAFQEILRLIKEVEAPRPSTRLSSSAKLPSIAAQRGIEPAQLSRAIRGDLDWIVMKSLEKERSRRYETATGLARDIERYLRDEPVEATPPSVTYQLRKLAYKHRALLATAATIVALLVIGTTLSTWLAIRATRAEASERAAKEKALTAAGEERNARQAEAMAKREALTEAAAARAARQQAESSAAAERAARQSAVAREAETNAVLTFVQSKIVAAARPKGAGGLGYDVTLRQALQASLPFVDESFTDQPLIEARLRRTLGSSFSSLGEYSLAADQGEAALALYKQWLGADDPGTLACMQDLANAYGHRGERAKAIQLRKEALNLQIAKLGPDDPYVLLALSNTAVSYSRSGDYAEALKLNEQVLARRQATLGPNDRKTLMSMHNVARNYSALGMQEEARGLHEKTLALRRANLGATDAETLDSMYGLAATYAMLRLHEKALALHKETLDLRKAYLAPDHPKTLDSMRAVASCLMALGRGTEAVPIIDECMKLAEGRALDPRLIPYVMELRLRHFQKVQDVAGCRQTAEMWEKLNLTDAESLYTAACFRAVTAKVILTTEQDAAAEGDRAMQWLHKAVSAGYANAAQLAQDKDLDALRDREDFQRLLASLDVGQANEAR
jgi:eukaryotic-like serine/threonine-protein kinase